ncbi:MAG: alpha/beta hydrolase [Thermodesulfobacteriota bacterium]
MTIVKTVVWALLLYSAYAGFIFLMQRHIMFPRGMIPSPTQAPPKLPGLERIWLETSSGKVEAWYLPPSTPLLRPGPIAIFAHGNGELIDFWPDELYPFCRMGIGVLLVEYPGYGRSGGSPSQKSITEAFATAYDLLKRRPEIDSDRIVLVGRSIGGGAVCALAKIRPSAAMILMSTFTGVSAFAKNFLVPPLFIRDPFDNLAAVKTYPKPILLTHGRHDEVIPYQHGVKLHQAARNGKLLTYECGHNDCLLGAGTFWQDVETFLRESGILK